MLEQIHIKMVFLHQLVLFQVQGLKSNILDCRDNRRFISNTLFGDPAQPDNALGISDFATYWGQFLAHGSKFLRVF